MSPSSSSRSFLSPLNEPPFTFFFSDPQPFQTGSSGNKGSLKISIFSSFFFGLGSSFFYCLYSSFYYFKIMASSSTSILCSGAFLFDFSSPRSSASFWVSVSSSSSFFFLLLSPPPPSYFLSASFGSSSSSPSSSCF